VSAATLLAFGLHGLREFGLPHPFIALYDYNEIEAATDGRPSATTAR